MGAWPTVWSGWRSCARVVRCKDRAAEADEDTRGIFTTHRPIESPLRSTATFDVLPSCRLRRPCTTWGSVGCCESWGIHDGRRVCLCVCACMSGFCACGAAFGRGDVRCEDADWRAHTDDSSFEPRVLTTTLVEVLEAGWEQWRDDGTGDCFYFHRGSGQKTWAMGALAAPVREGLPRSKAPPPSTPADVEDVAVSEEDPLAGLWTFACMPVVNDNRPRWYGDGCLRRR